MTARRCELLREVSEAIEPPVLERQGEVVKRLGDGLMAAFWGAPDAVAAAFDAAERVAPIEVDGYRPRLRTGVHLGRPRKLGGDYFGVDVNVAARLADAAKPSEILVSDRALEKLDAGNRRGEEAALQRQGGAEGDERLRRQPRSRLTMTSSSSAWLSRTNSASGPASASPSSFMPR